MPVDPQLPHEDSTPQSPPSPRSAVVPAASGPVSGSGSDGVNRVTTMTAARPPRQPGRSHRQVSRRGFSARAVVTFAVSLLGLLLIWVGDSGIALGWVLCLVGMTQGARIRPRLMDKAMRGRGYARLAFWLGLAGVLWGLYRAVDWYVKHQPA